MDKLRKLAVLIFEGAPVGVRVVGDSGVYDISLSFLEGHQVYLFNQSAFRKLTLIESSEGMLVTKAERKGLKVKDGELHFEVVLALLKQHESVKVGRIGTGADYDGISSVASATVRLAATSVLLH